MLEFTTPIPPNPPQDSKILVGSSSHDQAKGNPAHPDVAVVRYRECMKNHAASIGGHALDGCGEFIPSSSVDQAQLHCAACACHRNFHKREVEGESLVCEICEMNRREHNRSKAAAHNMTLLPAAPFPEAKPAAAQMLNLVAFDHQLQLQEATFGLMRSSIEQSVMMSPLSMIKKRSRTKFSMDQKERMFVFAEKLGWRIQKQDEVAVHDFCAEVGVKRHVLKVWMHNNKHTLGKGSSPSTTSHSHFSQD